MRAAWRRGLAAFPSSAELKERLAQPSDAELDAYLLRLYSPGRRIDTRLEEIWQALRDAEKRGALRLAADSLALVQE